ncbi:MAG: hypothetical protein AMXMBFR7_00410 [Planctomycetota bacterium]
MTNKRQTPWRRRLTKVLITIGPVTVLAGIALQTPALTGFALLLCFLAVAFGKYTVVCAKCGKKYHAIGVEVLCCYSCGAPYFEEAEKHDAV